MNQKNIKIAIAGTGYVGLSNAVLLSQHHEVWAVDILQEKVDLINSGNRRLWIKRLKNIWQVENYI